ncbi:muramoyltetrapeptide carboxypeptidase [Desulfacinum hydrothermale DSM 13146]|uniref:Muramoyltetrapeptide carboxypeptidase n=1 Tax=Desulfacinum hydrothermale DSM 13146 TaxID=1121390 RepID=A0A1W1X227_9BACT|nr:LD-carboxypeptidase [Desulfacinum hydrothermale]SMC17992.1 muramoyltetrapeptide carboxypeptidase [Desulfacinum hydrothermale DSM 13146]
MIPRRSRRFSSTHKRPAALKPGMTMALVAPAGPFPSAQVETIQRLLRDEGFQVVTGRHIHTRDRYLAGPDAFRARDLLWALTDPQVDAIFTIRGGYGSSRLLTRLPLSSLGAKAKLLCGYSDITFLHAALGTLARWVTFHGPNAIEFAEDPQVLKRTLAFLQGTRPFQWALPNSVILQEGRAEGRVVGGNLTCFSHLVGTPYMPDVDGALLFLEDKAEAPYRIDRMLMHLKAAGILHRIAGLIGGTFTDCGDPDEIRMILKEYTAARPIPVVLGLPFGHGHCNDVLPLGARFILDTSRGVLACEEPPLDP